METPEVKPFYVKEIPDTFFKVKEDGSFTTEKPTKQMSNSMYWDSKIQLIALMMLFSSLGLMLIILSETLLLEQTWSLLIEGLGNLFNSFVGLF